MVQQGQWTCPKNRQVTARAVGRSTKSSTCIGRFIDLYFDHKEIRIRGGKQ